VPNPCNQAATTTNSSWLAGCSSGPSVVKQQHSSKLLIAMCALASHPHHHAARRYPNVEAMGLLNRSDVDAVWAFQRQTGVRGVKFGAFLGATLGVLLALSTRSNSVLSQEDSHYLPASLVTTQTLLTVLQAPGPAMLAGTLTQVSPHH
jgi:hypothetical protein